MFDVHCWQLGVDILIECSTHCSSNNLNAFADAQHRYLTVVSHTCQQQFLLVTYRCYAMQFTNRFLSQIERIDVAASTEDNTIQRLQLVSKQVCLLVWWNHNRNTTSHQHRAIIALGQGTCLLAQVTCDTNDRMIRT